MYYYGNDGTWNHGVKSFLPTGWVGLAESTNGIDWIKVDPPPNNDNDINLKKGSVFGPSADVNEWDSIHVGVGDVVRLPNGELHMYYFGGSNEKVSFGPGGGPVGGTAAPPASIQGLRMRIGRARSFDNGRTWERMGAAVLDHDDEEGIFASWPRLILPLDDDEILSKKKNVNTKEDVGPKPWRMTYHSYDGSKWRAFGATSLDYGENWTKDGLILEGGVTAGTTIGASAAARALAAGEKISDPFDSSGIGTRGHCRWRAGLLMIYEGVDGVGTHRLGAACCPDGNGGSSWTKMKFRYDGLGSDGGPIASPGESPMMPWTKQVIGTPFPMTMKDGSVRLYHCGKAGPDDKMSIGLIISKTGDIGMAKHWSPASPDTGTMLMDVVGLTSTEWNRICKRVPEAVLYDPAKCVACLQALGERLSLDRNEMKKKIVLRLPQIMGYDYERDVRPGLDALMTEGNDGIGEGEQIVNFTVDELRSLVLKCPQIVGMDFVTEVSPALQKLRETLKLDGAGVKEEVLRRPASLELPVRGGVSSGVYSKKEE